MGAASVVLASATSGASSTEPAAAGPSRSAPEGFSPAGGGTLASVSGAEAASRASGQPAPIVAPVDPLGGVWAHVSVGDKTYDVEANRLGMFPRIYVNAKATISVEVDIPRGTPGQTIAIETQDGGLLVGHHLGAYLALNENRRLPFAFRAGTQEGIYRVEVRSGDAFRQLEFWVGVD